MRTGVTLCAGQIGVSLDFLRLLLARMGELGLTELVWEFKLRLSTHPETTTWHYYTPEEVREVLELARGCGVEVVPLVNAPGHMGIWLESHPEFALRRADGTIDPEGRLDITNPQAVAYYLSIVEEYLEVIPGTWWHMGADEYMLHDSFENYPQVMAAAQSRFGSTASEYDLFNDFVNQVNDFVRSGGRRLRVWNDGIHETSQASLESDIVVEYWKDEGLRIRDFVAHGHEIVNVSEDLYWSRSHEPYRVDSKALWDCAWTARSFIGGQILPESTSGKTDSLLGLRVSIWPDEAFRQTENEVWEAIQDSLVLVAVLSRGKKSHGDRAFGAARGSWDAVIDTFPPVKPLPEPQLPEGVYQVSDLNAVAPGPWRVTWTPDHYVTLTDESSGKNLALLHGAKHLGVVTEVGAGVELAEPADMGASWPDGWDEAEARNTQKWVMRPVEFADDNNLVFHFAHATFTLSPALTGMVLRREESGKVTQVAGDSV